MVYSNHFVMCVLVNGTPLSELANGVVSLPFGSEYALRLRNKNGRRAVVKIYIDGENVSGNGYIIPANDFVDIKRHHDKDRSFKFVSLDSGEAVEFGKNGPNDDKVKGTIEARFYLEKERPAPPPVQPIIHDHHHHHHHHDHNYYPRPRPIWYTNTSRTCDYGGGEIRRLDSDVPLGDDVTYESKRELATKGIRSLRSRTKTCSAEPASLSMGFAAPTSEVKTSSELKDGCTVEGHTTGQNFYTSWIETEDTYTSLKVFLQGYSGNDSSNFVAAADEKPKRKTNKELRLSELEAENEELRRKLAEAENEELKKKVNKKKTTAKPKKRR